MISYHLTSAVLGIAFAAIILLLVRRDHLRIRYSIWWLFIAGVVLFLGLFPGTVDAIGALFGVAYPPTLLLILGIAALLIKILYMDIEHSRLERSLRRLTQRIAMYEAESHDKGSRSWCGVNSKAAMDSSALNDHLRQKGNEVL